MNVGMTVFAVAVVCVVGQAAQRQPFPDQAQQAVATIELLGGRVYRTPTGEVDIVAMTGNHVTDTHLEMLRFLPSVRSLDLDGSQVTDAGLERLLQLPNLEEVSLRRTRVTPAAVAAFKVRHPKVYHVTLSPGFRPGRLIFAATMGFPLLLGGWLIQAAWRKQSVLSPRDSARGVGWGAFLIVAAVVFALVAIVQVLGFEFHLADLFN
jgi:hypothetical protein